MNTPKCGHKTWYCLQNCFQTWGERCLSASPNPANRCHRPCLTMYRIHAVAEIHGALSPLAWRCEIGNPNFVFWSLINLWTSRSLFFSVAFAQPWTPPAADWTSPSSVATAWAVRICERQVASAAAKVNGYKASKIYDLVITKQLEASGSCTVGGYKKIWESSKTLETWALGLQTPFRQWKVRRCGYQAFCFRKWLVCHKR